MRVPRAAQGPPALPGAAGVAPRVSQLSLGVTAVTLLRAPPAPGASPGWVCGVQRGLRGARAEQPRCPLPGTRWRDWGVPPPVSATCPCPLPCPSRQHPARPRCPGTGLGLARPFWRHVAPPAEHWRPCGAPHSGTRPQGRAAGPGQASAGSLAGQGVPQGWRGAGLSGQDSQ